MDTSKKILNVIEQFGPVHISKIHRETHFVLPIINARLSQLAKKGLVEKVGHGHWQLKGGDKDGSSKVEQKPVLEGLLQSLRKGKSQ
jgi:Mn-dependent DtxR family transcriptional regulator